MLDFLFAHADVVNAVLNGMMVLIWTAYLHFFLINHLRQSRCVLHIDIGAAMGARSRCLVTNLSPSPVYVQGILADLVHNANKVRTIVTDRNEISEDDVENPLARTNRGTLHPGQTVDIGSLSDLVSRARISLGENWSADQIDSVTITIVAILGHSDRIVGASKSFCAEEYEGYIKFTSQRILTYQLRPRETRAQFSDILRDQTQA